MLLVVLYVVSYMVVVLVSQIVCSEFVIIVFNNPALQLLNYNY